MLREILQPLEVIRLKDRLGVELLLLLVMYILLEGTNLLVLVGKCTDSLK